MARWEEVLDIQLELHDWLTSPYGVSFGEGYFESAFHSPTFANEGNPKWLTAEDAQRRGRDWAKSLGVNTFNAEPVWVDPDMMSVVENAVEHFIPEPLLETDLITPNGLLVLPRSLWLRDPNGRMLSWKMAVWFPIPGNGIHLALIHDTHDRDDVDMTEEEMRRLGKRFTTRWLPTHVVNWYFGQMHPDAGASYDAAGLPGVPDERDTTAHAQLQGTWRLLTQYLAVQGRMRPPRAYAKRAARAKLPNEHVTIVRLRRPHQPQDPDHEPTTVNWTKRWMVGGHWRNQWYATLGMHRQIWISPFVKGPADLPLVVNKARVFEFVR